MKKLKKMTALFMAFAVLAGILSVSAVALGDQNLNAVMNSDGSCVFDAYTGSGNCVYSFYFKAPNSGGSSDYVLFSGDITDKYISISDGKVYVSRDYILERFQSKNLEERDYAVKYAAGYRINNTYIWDYERTRTIKVEYNYENPTVITKVNIKPYPVAGMKAVDAMSYMQIESEPKYQYPYAASDEYGKDFAFMTSPYHPVDYTPMSAYRGTIKENTTYYFFFNLHYYEGTELQPNCIQFVDVSGVTVSNVNATISHNRAFVTGTIKFKSVGTLMDLVVLPKGEQYADYNTDLTLRFTAENLPKGFILVTESGAAAVSDGKNPTVIVLNVGQLKDKAEYIVKVADEHGHAVQNSDNAEMTSCCVVNVDNSFMAKLSAFFRFIFSGFKWGSTELNFN